MQSEIRTAISEEVQRQLSRVVAQYMMGQHYRLYLFGSRAQGRSTPRSDYDLGLLAEHPIGLAVISQIRAGLEALPIMQTVDLIDLHAAPPDLVHSVLDEGELLDEH